MLEVHSVVADILAFHSLLDTLLQWFISSLLLEYLLFSFVILPLRRPEQTEKREALPRVA